jgi:hypothetical protein
VQALVPCRNRHTTSQASWKRSSSSSTTWRLLTYEPGLDFDLKRQDDADDANVPGNWQEQRETLSIPEKTEPLPDGIGHPAVSGCFVRVKDNRPLLLRKAICRLEFPQAFELLSSNAGRKRRVPVVLDLIGCVGFKTNSDDGKLAEHFGQCASPSQRCRHAENGFRKIGRIRQREKDVFRIGAALGDQPIDWNKRDGLYPEGQGSHEQLKEHQHQQMKVDG